MKLMLKHKVVGLALLVSLIPVLVLLVITTIQKGRISKVVIEELDYPNKKLTMITTANNG